MRSPKAPGVAHWVPLVGPTMLVLDDDQWALLIEILEMALEAARLTGDGETEARLLPMLEQFWGIRASLQTEEDDHPS